MTADAAARLDDLGARTVRLEAVDLDGVVRGKRFGRDRFLAGAAGSGFGWSHALFAWDLGVSVYGHLPRQSWMSSWFGDVRAVPDLETLAAVPWQPGTAAVLVDFVDASGRPVEVAPRRVLRRLEEGLCARGVALSAAMEVEFVLLRETPDSAAAKGYRDLLPADPGRLAYSLLRAGELHAFLDDLERQCEAAGVALDMVHTEPGPGMVEASLAPLPLLRAADQAVRFKLAAKQVARRHGLLATFMAQWSEAHSGCGAHVHHSLWTTQGEPDTATPSGELTPRARDFLAGELEALPELCVLLNPTVNSYRRCLATSATPRNVSWGVDNRSAAVRVILGSPAAARLELRRPGADVNPYLALAACAAGGLHGLAAAPPLPPALGIRSAYHATAEEAAPLPAALHEAVPRFRASAVARRYLGDEFVDLYATSREWELEQFARAVTDWEVRRYLEQV